MSGAAPRCGASVLRQCLRLLRRQPNVLRRSWPAARRLGGCAQLAGVGSFVCGFAAVGVARSMSPGAEAEAPEQQPRNWRQQRFLAFASVEFDGTPYLTAEDFLRSVTTQSLPSRRRRRVLSEAEHKEMVHATPSKRRGGVTLFRSMGSQGLVSYTEFLLLLSLLAKSSSGFCLAFRVFDRNSDGDLDANEFQLMYETVCGLRPRPGASSQPVSTSLSVHFFGHKSRGVVTAKEFSQFADNLQKEVLEVEFQEQARGAAAIEAADFAEALLRRTHLSDEGKRLRLQLLRDRQDHQGCAITCQQYQQFFQFLCNTEDLFYALRMFEISGQSIGQDDFQQAVRAVTGSFMPPAVLSVVFSLFDIDGDGLLSYSEFLSLFSDSEIALKSKPEEEAMWPRFRKCVKRYMVLQQ